ncbi:MAG: IS982 family transposase, partial [Paludibacter sp.]|nr:IS982 family transposase [Paludibacter sp.]
MLTLDKITEIFCIADDFCKYFDAETAKMPKLPTTDGKYHRNRPCEMSQSEIITILLLFHFGDFKNFKHFYLHYICVHLKNEFPKALSYNRFVQIEH